MTRVIGLAGWSGAGKTTLVTKLVPRLVARGLEVSTIKHAHHSFDLDQPGKDSHSHRLAGATEVLVSSSARWALLHELRGAAEMRLEDLIGKLTPVDLIIIEGFKRASHPKLEVYREAIGKPPLYGHDPKIVAVAADVTLPSAQIPVLAIDDVEGIVEVILACAEPATVLARHADEL